MISALQMARMRAHPVARELEETGWLILADLNVCGDVVYLVSKYRDVAMEFPHGKPYHEHLRAYCTASIHAQSNPEKAPEAAKEDLVIVPLQVAA